jgi:hypothetical protein
MFWDCGARLRIETERMTLRLPQHSDFRAWAACATSRPIS